MGQDFKKIMVFRDKICPLECVKLPDLPKFCLLKLSYDYVMANLSSGTIFFMALTSPDCKKSEAMLYSFSFDRITLFSASDTD